jgi:hypothetical protein
MRYRVRADQPLCIKISTRQIQALKSEGCAKVFSDTASGKSMVGRPELYAAHFKVVREAETGL